MGSSLLEEIGKESQHYSATGGVIIDPFWSDLAKTRDENPVEFDGNRPNFGPFFTPPAVLGTLPDTPLLDDLRERDAIDPARFAHWHHRMAPLLGREQHVLHCPPPPPPVPSCGPPRNDEPGCTPPPGVPEPGSMALALIAVAVLAAARRLGILGR